MEQVEPQAEEELVAEWTEPEISQPVSKRRTAAIVLAGVALAAIMAGLGFWQSDFTYYLAAAASLVGAAAIALQKRRPTQPLPVSLTTQRLIVGRRGYLLTELAGFWLETEGETCVVNVEPSKPAMFPIAFRFPGTEEDAREALSSQLHELEPRRKDLTDTINRYFRV